jgi:hypothetical protein
MLVNMVAGAKPAAQATVEALIAVANSRHLPGAHAWPSRLRSDASHDHLCTSEEARGYFAEEGVAVPEAELERRDLTVLRTVRKATWALTAPNAGRESMRLVRPLLASVRFRVGDDGEYRPVQSGWSGFVAALLPALLELRRTKAPLKICRNRDCGWLFVDRTKNQSRVWCDMAACGNRAKVKRHLRRRAGRPPAAARGTRRSTSAGAPAGSSHPTSTTARRPAR